MSDVRTILERGYAGATPPPDGFERMLRRRDRKRRNQRIAASAVGLGIAIGLAWVGASVIRSTPSVPAGGTNPPAPSPEWEHPPGRIDWESVPGVSIDRDALVDIRTGEVTPLPDGIGTYGDAGGYGVAPGGDVLFFEASADGSRRKQIFVANVDGSNVRRLTGAPGGADAGGWSPDGTTIVARIWGPEGPGTNGGQVDLVIVDVATGEWTVLASGRDHDFMEPHFSADGRQILFGRFGTKQGPHTFGIPVEGGDAALVFEERWNAIFSPDGRTIAYLAQALIHNVGGPEVRLADADGSHPRPLVPGDGPFGWDPSWSPDGTRIAYTKAPHDDGPHDDRFDRRIAVVDVASGTPTFSVFASHLSAGVWFDDDTLLVDVGASGV